jgi:putative ABC transport system ATP-binding protein
MLEVRNIYKTFHSGTPNEVRALQGITIEVREGSFTVLLGTNGSGKSTLLNAIAGSFRLDGGGIFLDGKDITRWPEHRRAAYMGRVFQNPFSGTAPDMTIAENLALASQRGKRRGLGIALNAQSRMEFQERVKNLNMGLEDRLDNIIGALSGGQRQALTLLMATWLQPRILLLDEHTAALDPKTGNKIIQLTEEIIHRDKLTAIMVTHSMQQAVNMGDRIIMLHKGKVAYDFQGEEKRRLRVNDLLALFEEVRQKEQIDLSAAEMLSRNYV